MTGVGGGGYRAAGCGQSATYVCAGVCVRESGSGNVESSGHDAVVPGGGGDGIKWRVVESQGAHYQLPEWFTRDEDAKFEVYRDDNRHHAVRLTVAETSDDEVAWIDAHYAGVETWVEKLDGRDLHFATVVGAKLRVSVAVLATGEKLYQLACSMDDVKKPKPDVTCTTILRSLRVSAKPTTKI